MANLLESDKSSRLGLRPRTSLSQPIGSYATLESDVGIQHPNPLVESLLLSTRFYKLKSDFSKEMVQAFPVPVLYMSC